MDQLSVMKGRSGDKNVGPWKIDTVHNVDCSLGLKDVPDDSLDIVVIGLTTALGTAGNSGG